MVNAVVICEECRQPLKPGDDVAFTDDESLRYWHKACFDASLTPFDQWPKQDK